MSPSGKCFIFVSWHSITAVNTASNYWHQLTNIEAAVNQTKKTISYKHYPFDSMADRSMVGVMDLRPRGTCGNILCVQPTEYKFGIPVKLYSLHLHVQDILSLRGMFAIILISC